LAGSFLRPVGGYLADRAGGAVALRWFLLGIAGLAGAVATAPPLQVVAILFFLLMALLGMGNGAVFQLVAQRFRAAIGAVTGLVGAAGGVGGFFLPSLMGLVRQATHTFAPGFLLFAVAALGCLAALSAVGRGWSWARAGAGCLREAEAIAQPALAVGGAE